MCWVSAAFAFTVLVLIFTCGLTSPVPSRLHTRALKALIYQIRQEITSSLRDLVRTDEFSLLFYEIYSFGHVISAALIDKRFTTSIKKKNLKSNNHFYLIWWCLLQANTGLLSGGSCSSLNLTELAELEEQPLSSQNFSLFHCHAMKVSAVTTELADHLQKIGHYCDTAAVHMAGRDINYSDCSLPHFAQDDDSFDFVRCLLELLDRLLSKTKFWLFFLTTSVVFKDIYFYTCTKLLSAK